MMQSYYTYEMEYVREYLFHCIKSDFIYQFVESLKMAECGKCFLPCSDTDEILDALPKQLRVQNDVKVLSPIPHYAKVLSILANNTIHVVGMVTDM